MVRRVCLTQYVCQRVLVCVVDVAGYLEEYLEVAVVKVHTVVFY